MPQSRSPLYVGIDLGTSGCRAIAIESNGRIIAESRTSLPPIDTASGRAQQNPTDWWSAVQRALEELIAKIDPGRIKAICVDGTSGTVLLCDENGTPLTPALMYSDSSCNEEAERIRQQAPHDSGAHGASSSLAKALYLLQHGSAQGDIHILHQADWILGRLSGDFHASDENNCLKLGYDPVNRRWPAWLLTLMNGNARSLPVVRIPGTPYACIHAGIADHFGISNDTSVCAGTTDSIAALIATGASQTGDAVTSLGTTMVLKVISDKPVFSPEHGVYSHRLGDYWLVGGASNVGGGILLDLFGEEKLHALSQQLSPDRPTGLCYYPLAKPGERFPLSDTNKQPVLTPRPDSDVEFLQGLLESMARIECDGYRLLHALGAPYPARVLTAGGGSKNNAWLRIREKTLGVPVHRATHTEAAYGTALLARNSELFK